MSGSRSLRWLWELLFGLVLAGVFFAVGLVAAEPLLHLTAAPLKQLAMTSPKELWTVQWHLGAACAPAPLYAFAAGLLRRGVAKQTPSWPALGLYLALPALATAAGIAGGVLVMRLALADAAADPFLAPVMTVASLSVAPWAVRAGLAGGLVSGAVASWRG